MPGNIMEYIVTHLSSWALDLNRQSNFVAQVAQVGGGGGVCKEEHVQDNKNGTWYVGFLE